MEDVITELQQNQVFVFGSNANGNHVGGAAKLALDKFGAKQGEARGLQGQSYGFETLDKNMQQVSMQEIELQFKELFKTAEQNPNLEFLLTKVGCGIAGFADKEIRDCFNSEDVPSNVILPQDWVYKRLWKSMPADLKPRGFQFEVGKWHHQEGVIEVCSNGFHASTRAIDAMRYVPCEVLALVEVRGNHDIKSDKEAWQEMRIIETYNWSKKDSVALAIFSAESVSHLYTAQFPGDNRVVSAIEAAKRVLADDTEVNRAEAVELAKAAIAAEVAEWGAEWAARAAARAAEAAAWPAARAAARAVARAVEAAEAAEATARAAARKQHSDIIESWVQDRIRDHFGDLIEEV